jgi:dipeptidyl aminopeptidase/acylaminoacyl peptidase
MKGEHNMRKTFDYKKHLSCSCILFCLSLGVFGWVETAWGAQPPNESKLREQPNDKSELNLKAIPFKIVYETYRETDDRENWELYLMNADGSNATNLTRTPDVDEMYPHVSPDGTKICFVTDERTGEKIDLTLRTIYKVRSIYYMNIDGTGQVKVADHARQPCWSPDGKRIAYLKAEYERYTTRDYGTIGVFFYDIATGRHEQHPNRDLHHLYNICWPADSKWFVGTVHGGMGFGHAIIAFEAHGTAVFDLTKYGIKGCRPDLSSDSRKITWGRTESELCFADIDLTWAVPRVADVRSVIKCREGYYVAHTDFSPDGRYIAFGYGPWVEYSVGNKATGWNICVSDLSGKWVQITTDGKHNKEPDWVPITTTNR